MGLIVLAPGFPDPGGHLVTASCGAVHQDQAAVPVNAQDLAHYVVVRPRPGGGDDEPVPELHNLPDFPEADLDCTHCDRAAPHCLGHVVGPANRVILEPGTLQAESFGKRVQFRPTSAMRCDHRAVIRPTVAGLQ